MKVYELVCSYKDVIQRVEIEHNGEPVYFKPDNIDKNFLNMYVESYSIEGTTDLYIKVVVECLFYDYMYNLDIIVKYFCDLSNKNNTLKPTFEVCKIFENAIERGVEKNVLEEVSGIRIFDDGEIIYIHDIKANIFDNFALLGGRIYYKTIDNHYEYNDESIDEHDILTRYIVCESRR